MCSFCVSEMADNWSKTTLKLTQVGHLECCDFCGFPLLSSKLFCRLSVGGSLLNFLRKHGSQQTIKTLVKICQDAAAGMTYLASMNCIHR